MPFGIVILAAAHRTNDRHHVLGAPRFVRLQPFAEQILDLERQPQQRVARARRAGFRARRREWISISLSFSAGMIGAVITVVGMPAADSARMVSIRFCGVAARGSIARASFRSSVVTDSATFAKPSAAMGARMSMSRVISADLVTMPTGFLNSASTCKHGARYFPLALDRLIGVGVGPHRDDLRLVGGLAQFRLQKLRRIGFHQKLSLEIESRREAEISVGGPRETIDAAMLAAAIGIDRLVERNIRRVVPRDDGAGGIARNVGLQRRRSSSPSLQPSSKRTRFSAS